MKPKTCRVENGNPTHVFVDDCDECICGDAELRRDLDESEEE